MSKKTKKILAIIALVFIGLFTVSFVAFLVDRTLFNGAIGFLALFTGGIGLALFLAIKLSRSNLPTDNDEPEEAEKTEETKEFDGSEPAKDEETNLPKLNNARESGEENENAD